MSFEELLDDLYGFDAEIFAHDCLFVFINYRTRKRKIFHNCPRNDLQEWLDKERPILMGYNANSYDKYILKGWLAGFSPEELKKLNDYIIEGGNGWEFDYGEEYIELPYIWDLMGCIKTFKSLKELEGNLRLSITETTVPFDLPTKWNKQQKEEVIYYCTKDVEALFPIFDILMTKYKSKYIIAKLGNIEPAYALSMTDANLTATLLKAKKKTHKDNFAYVYPKQIDKSKIPKEVLDYIDDLIAHNDLDYKPPGPKVRMDDCIIQFQQGGLHGCKENEFIYNEGVDFKCD